MRRWHPANNRSSHHPQYTAAVKTSSLEPTAKSLDSLGGLFKKDAKLVSVLSTPTLSADDKSAIVAELIKASSSSNEAVKNFLKVLAENNRLGLLPDVVSKFGELMSASRNEVELVITSATVRDRHLSSTIPGLYGLEALVSLSLNEPGQMDKAIH